MKTILSGAFLCMIASGAMAAQITNDGILYANKISVHNIGAIQQAISTAVFGAYDYYGMHVGFVADTMRPAQPNTHQDTTNAAHMYGTVPMYGTLPMYGEWNDDGSVTRGRSGGEYTANPNLTTWVRWSHARATEKFDHFKEVDINNDLIIAGVGTTRAKIGQGYVNIGAFGGYVGGHVRNRYVDMDENGGYLGFYGAYNINQLRVAATATIGKIDSEMPHKFGGDSLDNTWFDITARTTYDILIDPTFTLQPGLRASYSWVGSSDYTVLERTPVTNENFNLFSISPQLRAIKHIGSGWFATAGVRYIWRMHSGGDGHAAPDIKLQDFDTGNYTEYGIGIEKAFMPLNISLDINRQDGARNGWLGGAHIKLIF